LGCSFDLHPESLEGLLEGKLTRAERVPKSSGHLWGPDICQGQVSPPAVLLAGPLFLGHRSLGTPVCPSVQFQERGFALWPQFSGGSRKTCWFSVCSASFLLKGQSDDFQAHTLNWKLLVLVPYQMCDLQIFSPTLHISFQFHDGVLGSLDFPTSIKSNYLGKS